MNSEARSGRPQDPPHGIVAAGYDQIGERYAAHTARHRTGETYYRRFLDRCLDSIPEGGLVLDLGCGAGIVGVEIARRARVVGVDISSTQIHLARHRVPCGSFVLADMARVEFRPSAFDAIAAFWSLIHVRRDLHADLLRRLHTWLRPGGLLFGTCGSGDNPDEREQDFFGAPMYWSHFDAETNRRLLSEAGFRLLQADVVEDLSESPLWVIAVA
ncbi:MAG: class I SAM-dependent methyltransferase [Actinomycetota bacterium]